MKKFPQKIFPFLLFSLHAYSIWKVNKDLEVKWVRRKERKPNRCRQSHNNFSSYTSVRLKKDFKGRKHLAVLLLRYIYHIDDNDNYNNKLRDECDEWGEELIRTIAGNGFIIRPIPSFPKFKQFLKSFKLPTFHKFAKD